MPLYDILAAVCACDEFAHCLVIAWGTVFSCRQNYIPCLIALLSFLLHVFHLSESKIVDIYLLGNR